MISPSRSEAKKCTHCKNYAIGGRNRMNRSVVKRCAECNDKFEKIVRENTETGFRYLREFVAINRRLGDKATGWDNSFHYHAHQATIYAGCREVKWMTNEQQSWTARKTCKSQIYFEFLSANAEERKKIAKQISRLEIIPLLALRKRIPALGANDKNIYCIIFKQLCAITLCL